MKKLILFPLLMLSLLALNPGCATTKTDPTGVTVPMSKIEQAQDAATKSVLSLGEVIIVAPGALKAARTANYLTRDQFNDAVDIYNRALASYSLLNKALQATITAGVDPTSATGYVAAMATFVTDKALLDNIMTATGGIK
jgi:hypothetical protein